MMLTKYKAITKLNARKDLSVLFTFLEQGIIVLSNEKMSAIENNRFLELSENEIETLESIGAIVKNEQEDEAKVLYYWNKLPYANSTLSLTILTTFECNLHCYYCLQNPIKTGMSMTLENLTDLKKWLISLISNNFVTNVRIEYIGGEPLLNLEPMRELFKLFKDYNIIMDASLVTNGVLLQESVIRELSSIGINKVQLTFDGIKNVHDSIKQLGENRSSYDINYKAVDFLVSMNFEVNIRINFPKNDYKSAIETLSSLKELKNKNKITVYFSELYDYNISSCQNKILNNDEVITKHLENYKLLRDAVKLGFRIPFPYNCVTCSAESNLSFVITPNLDVYKCYNTVGYEDFKVGKISDGSLNVQSFLPLRHTYFDKCAKCKYFLACKPNCLASELYTNTFVCGFESLELITNDLLPLFIESNFQDKLMKIR